MLNNNGDEMRGVLNMNGRLLYGLSVDYPPSYRGDEAVSWAQLTNHIERTMRSLATLDYVNTHMLNQIGAEIQGDLQMNERHIRGLPVGSITNYRGYVALM